MKSNPNELEVILLPISQELSSLHKQRCASSHSEEIRQMGNTMEQRSASFCIPALALPNPELYHMILEL